MSSFQIRMWKDRVFVSSCVLIVLSLLAAMNASALQVGNFVKIDVPGAILTLPRAVNNAGVIVGRYDDANGAVHGFTLSNGVLTTVDYPGGQGTVLMGINDAGQIVGRFVSAGIEHGFLLSNGVYTQLDFPGASDTQAHGINLAGQIVGRYLTGKNAGQGLGTGRQNEHGWLLSNGVFTSVDYPNGVTTDAWAIAADGDIVGDWSDNGALQSGSVHGYVLHDGQFTRQDLPGAVITASRQVNAGGVLVGIYWDSKFTDHGFLLDSGGSYSSFDFPGAAWTDGNGLNDHGLIVGAYGDSKKGAVHGFAASIAN